MCTLFFFKQKTAYEMRISDWSSDVCSSDLLDAPASLLDRRRAGVYGAHRLGHPAPEERVSGLCWNRAGGQVGRDGRAVALSQSYQPVPAAAEPVRAA